MFKPQLTGYYFFPHHFIQDAREYTRFLLDKPNASFIGQSASANLRAGISMIPNDRLSLKEAKAISDRYNTPFVYQPVKVTPERSIWPNAGIYLDTFTKIQQSSTLTK